MAYHGDFLGTETVYCFFATVQATGAPTTLSGTPKLRCYKAGSTTESSDLTPTVDFDSRTGLNLVAIDLTGDSGFYATGNDFQIVITAGTVNSVSAIGYVVGTFSVQNRTIKADVTKLLGTAWLTPGTAGTPDVNAKLHGGTSQTGRDIGASVLLSTGTGTGQLDFTSGVVKSNLAQILGTALTETAGLLAGGFKKFFNVATPTGTVNSIPDAVAGAASGLAIVGSNVGTATSVTGAVGSVTGNVGGNVTGSVGSVVGAVGSVTGNVGGNVVGSTASVTAGVTVTTNNDKTGYALSTAGILAIWHQLTAAVVTASTMGKLILDYLDAAISSRGTGTALDAAGVRSAVGLASASLDTQLDALPTNTELTAALNTLLTTAMTESYSADGATMTPAQALYELRALASEFSITGTTMTVKKKDGTTTAFTLTLDSATAPTSITRAT